MAATERPSWVSLMPWLVLGVACSDATSPELGHGLLITGAGAAYDASAPIPPTDLPGAPDGGAVPAETPPPAHCKDLEGFRMSVGMLLKLCQPCHNGTKGRATRTLDLRQLDDPSDEAQQFSCDQALTMADPNEGESAPLLAEVSPNDPTTVHDYKLDPTGYDSYRIAVQRWLDAERVAAMAFDVRVSGQRGTSEEIFAPAPLGQMAAGQALVAAPLRSRGSAGRHLGRRGR